jgi:NNP family nitrate/nitrite transporter-like MFS transporter
MTSQTPDARALATGLLAVAMVVLAIALGSHGFRHFDPALSGYAAGTMLAAFAVGYRFMVWAQRPPSRMYFQRGLQLLFRRATSATRNPDASTPGRTTLPLPYGAGTLGFALARNFVAQEFIRRRGGFRWIMHLCLSGGCTLAFAITFPLVFGWIHFESFPSDAEMYRVKLFGAAVDSFSVHSFKALMMFNALNISAVLVLVGLGMAAWRRLTDAGERATQTFFEDILPLLLIFAVTATGLALTVSYKFLAGRGHGLWAIVHMVSVVALLIYIPYGKLFHMFQRTCALAVSRYKKVGATGPRAHCRRCGEDYASQMHVDDLKVVLDQLGFDFRFATPRGRIHYQDICPACRRRLLALNQGRSVGR